MKRATQLTVVILALMAIGVPTASAAYRPPFTDYSQPTLDQYLPPAGHPGNPGQGHHGSGGPSAGGGANPGAPGAGRRGHPPGTTSGGADLRDFPGTAGNPPLSVRRLNLPAASSPSGSSRSLPFTGFSLPLFMALGFLLLALGGAIKVGQRTWRRSGAR